ncbi:ABC transporter permease [Micromonospora sp. HM5-17]|uniref:ABC transporter permease n=1 Tax=Micromonospora sp. HM5-17 TaxID=2487710 RepID=UPI0035189A1A
MENAAPDVPGDPEPAEPARRRGVSPTGPEDAFDDPEHGEPGRDRMGVHLLWELVLLVVVAVLVYLCNRDYPGLLRGDRLSSLLVFGTALGLLTLAAALTLRIGAPNLAIGPVGVAAALHFAENSDHGVVAVLIPATLIALVGGLVVALLVAGFHVPGWAASLAAALAVVVFIQQRTGPVEVQGDYDPRRHALYLFGGFAAVSVIAGLFGSVTTVRRLVGRFRPVADPALRRGAAAGVIVVFGTVLSMVLAVLAGVLLAAGGSGRVAPTTGFEWTGLALGAALLGGASAFGRRGGIAGGLLAATALTLFISYADERNLDIAPAAVAAVVVAAGLVVTRLVETYGRPGSSDGEAEPEWEPEPAGVARSGWGGTRSDPVPEPWGVSPSSHPGESRDRWGGDRWGVPER